MKKVTLHIAYTWDCDECGIENVAREVRPEFSEEDLQELRQEHGVQPWQTGHFFTRPDTVVCKECGTEFESIYQEEEVE